MASKIAHFYNHSSRYLGADVALSVMPLRDGDTESRGISAAGLGRHGGTEPCGWERWGGHGKKGNAGCRGALQPPAPHSLADGEPTHTHLSRSTYLQAAPQKPWRPAGQIWVQRKSIPRRMISFPEEKPSRIDFPWLLPTEHTNFPAEYFNTLVHKHSQVVKVSLSRQSVQY